MLKLSLKEGQYVNIGDDIRIVFAGGTGKHCRLLIDAPKELNIARSNNEQDPAKRKDTYYPEPEFPVKQRNKSSKSSGMRKNVRKRRKATNHVNRRLWRKPHPGSRLL